MHRARQTATAGRVAFVILVVMLVAAACGGQGDEDGASAGDAAATAAATATPTVDPGTATPGETEVSPRATIEWVEAVSQEWQAVTEGRWILAVDRRAAAETDPGAIPHVVFTEGLAKLYDLVADKTAEVPEGDTAVAAATSFEAELRSAAAGLRDLASELESAQGFDEDQLSEHSTAEQERAEAASKACFSFQDAVAAMGLPLIDCAGTGGGPGVWAPGTYRIEEFARPLQLSFDESVAVNVSSRSIEIQRVDPDYFPGSWAFWIVALNTLPAPGTTGIIVETVPYSEDLGEWLADFPTGISGQGVTELSYDDAPYWSVPLPAEGDDVPAWTVAIDETGGGASQIPLRAGSTVWHVPHDAGPVMVLAATKSEIPGAPDLAEMTVYVEQVLQTLEPLDDVTPPILVDPTPPAPGDPGLDELRSALRSLGEEWVSGGPVDETGSDCDEPEVTTGVVRLAAPSLNIGFDVGNIELLEFASKADRDDFFAVVETIAATCTASQFATFERTSLPEYTEAGSQIAVVVDVTLAFPAEEGEPAPEPERFIETNIWRTVGDVGLLAIRAESIDVALGFLEDLDLS